MYEYVSGSYMNMDEFAYTTHSVERCVFWADLKDFGGGQLQAYGENAGEGQYVNPRTGYTETMSPATPGI